MLKSYHVYSHDNMVIALDISQMRGGARISVCSSSCRITKSRRGWLRRGGGDSSDERLQDKCRFRGRLRSKDHKPAKRCCHRNLNQLFLRVRRGSEVATQDEVWGERERDHLGGDGAPTSQASTRGHGIHLPVRYCSKRMCIRTSDQLPR
jgi:hypothetical protein